MKKLLRRCQEHNIKLNKQKVGFKQTEVPYIGHLLTSEGVKADLSRIEVVLRVERPTDVIGVDWIVLTVGCLPIKVPSEITRGLTTFQTAHQEWNRICVGQDP